MATLHVTTRNGETRTLDGEAGMSVMQVIRDSDISELLALCGGGGCCATCHIYVDPADLERLSPMTPDEVDLLDSSDHRRNNSRLACQIQFGDQLHALHVQIAPED